MGKVSSVYFPIAEIFTREAAKYSVDFNNSRGKVLNEKETPEKQQSPPV